MRPFSQNFSRRGVGVSVGAVVSLLLFALCSRTSWRPASLRAEPSRRRSRSLLASAKSWGYQLQDVDPEVIAASPYDMVVIDYARDGTSETAFTPAELETMKKKPDGSRRIVLSYLSIGEAEKYRYYWKWYWGWFFGWLAPSWRDRQNTEWRGNYAVRYWEPGWQDIIVTGRDSYLDRIIKAGFDGVWLDKVDEFEFYDKKPDAPALMIAFVTQARRPCARPQAGLPGGAAERRGTAHRCGLPRRHRRHRQGGHPVRRDQGQAAEQARSRSPRMSPNSSFSPPRASRCSPSSISIRHRRSRRRGRGSSATVSFRTSPAATSTHCASATCPIRPQNRARNSGGAGAGRGLDIAVARCHCGLQRCGTDGR